MKKVGRPFGEWKVQAVDEKKKKVSTQRTYLYVF